MEFDEHEHQEDAPVHLPENHEIGKIGIRHKYRECLKNHAVGIGGHALDGCGEFMAAGEEGSLDALKCAACNCHRNFHRKEIEGEGFQNFSHFYPSGYLQVSRPRPLALPSTSRDEHENMSNPSSSGGRSGSRKRFRSKFSKEQKDKMYEMADRLGWRMQKQDDDIVNQFCADAGVGRHVFKVWMHNNKHTLGKKPNLPI